MSAPEREARRSRLLVWRNLDPRGLRRSAAIWPRGRLRRRGQRWKGRRAKRARWCLLRRGPAASGPPRGLDRRGTPSAV